MPQGSYITSIFRTAITNTIIHTFSHPAGELKWYVGRHLLNRVLLPSPAMMSAVSTSGSAGAL